MASASIHEQQAKHNYSLLKDLQEEEKFQDWQLTIAFYTALHIIDCALTTENPEWRRIYSEGGDPAGWHAVRKKCINSLFRDIFKNYRFLEEKSQLARYLEGVDKKAVDIITADQAKDYTDTHLTPIMVKFSHSW